VEVGGGGTVVGWQTFGGARVKLFDWPLRAFAEYRYQATGRPALEFPGDKPAGQERWPFRSHSAHR
jgi:hypothetical protein